MSSSSVDVESLKYGDLDQARGDHTLTPAAAGVLRNGRDASAQHTIEPGRRER